MISKILKRLTNEINANREKEKMMHNNFYTDSL